MGSLNILPKNVHGKGLGNGWYWSSSWNPVKYAEDVRCAGANNPGAYAKLIYERDYVRLATTF